MVPFVASVLVRGNEFDAAFRRRTQHVPLPIATMDSALARAVDVHRLLAPIIVAKWIVVHAPFGHEFIGNDRGWFPVVVGTAHEVGIAVPLNRTAHVVLISQDIREVMEWRDGMWRSTEEHYESPVPEIAISNRTISSMARRFAFTSTEALAHEALAAPRVVQPEIEPATHGFPTGGPARLHEAMWYRLMSATQRRFSMPDTELFEIDDDLINAGWHPIQRTGPPLLSALPGDVALAGRRIAARFYTADIVPFPIPDLLPYVVKVPGVE